MKIKELKQILIEIGDEFDEQPVLIVTGYTKEDRIKKYIGLDTYNWELGGTTKETTFLELIKED